MAGEVSQKVIKYIADLTQLKRDLAQINTLNRRLVNTYGKSAPQAVKRLGTTINSLKSKTIIDEKGVRRTIPLVEQVGQSFKTADGKIQTFVTTNKTLKDGTVQTSQSLKDMNKNSVSLGENIKRLASRAALTIPLWLALRAVVTGTIRTFTDSIKAIQEQDKAFQKARRNIEATASSQADLNIQFTKLQQEALKLSLASGKSVEELTHAFQRFATVGFDAETSLAGMQYATKLATVEFGDARETADAFARSMRVLIDRSDGAKSEAQQLAEAMALTDQLWQTNAFEIREFTQNLQKFAGTAKAANLSTRETIALLATLSTGGLANRAGRLLRTTILKALQNLDEVAQSLNLHIDPAVDSTFDVVLKLVGGLRELSKTQNVPKELADVLGELFTVRTTEVLASLRALEDTLKANAAITPDINKLDDTFDKVTKTTGILIDRIHNVNREAGKAFVTGIIGGEDFNDSLQKILGTLESIQGTAGRAGEGVRIAFLAATFQVNEIVKALKKLDQTKLTGFEKEAEDLFGLSKINESKVIKDLIQNIDEAIPVGIFGSTQDFQDAVKKVLEARLKELEAINQKTNAEQQALNIQKEQEISAAKQAKINQALVKDILARLKASGALESTILTATTELNKQYGIVDKFEDALERQLEKERAITEERRLRGKLSSDAIKLFQIAQTEGTQAAKRIGEVLAGNLDFASFVRRGGKELEVFKKEFEDIFKQKQAEAFFKGERVPGAKGLRGGFGITLPTEDEAIRKSAAQIIAAAQTEVSLAQRRLEIEEKINKNRLESLTRTEELLRTNRLAGQGNFQTVIEKSSPLDRGVVTSIPTAQIQQAPSFQFSSGGINISINAKNAEDLDKKIDVEFEKMKSETKKELKDKLLGKQTNTF